MAATKTIHTLQYNPYSNREKKGYTLYTGYAPYVVGSFTGINFNPADGVNTELILNTVSDKADYLLVMDGNTIESRWFILDCDRTRGGQYRLQLYRDVVYDNLPDVMSATAFIEKGWINDINNPLIFNQEALPTNQRKIDERLIRDETQTPWIVGYLPKHINLEEGETLTVDIEDNQAESIDIDTATFNRLSASYAIENELPQPLYATVDYAYIPGVLGALFRKDYSNRQFDFWGWKTNTTTSSSNGIVIDYPSSVGTVVAARRDTEVGTVLGNLLKSYKSEFTTAILDSHTQPKYDSIKQYKNKFVKYDNIIYKVTFEDSPERGTEETYDLTNLQGFYNQMITLVGTVAGQSDGTVTFNHPKDYPILHYQLNHIGIHLEVAKPSTNYSVTLPNDNTRLVLNEDANYTMFCMPYFDYLFRNQDATLLTLPGYLSRITAQSISRKFSGSNTLIDLQLLPYCPIRETLSTNARYIDYDKLIPFQATPIKDGDDNTLSYLFWCTTSKFALQRSYYYYYSNNNDLTGYKINSQTIMHRLCAPDKSAIYEYSPHKVINAQTGNRQEIYYNIRCTYKPYKPFIYVEVNSNSDSLYGASFIDGRGLICAGDFSLPQTSDAWETYQIQNKNYSNIFNREIQSIELSQDIARARENWQRDKTLIKGVANTIENIATGNIAGLASSAIEMSGQLMDQAKNRAWNNRLREDQLDLKKDLYQYNLENIQALPNTVLNIGTLTDVNKLYPYIEVYDCTEVEKQALRNKIKYNGMSIGVISEGLSQYLIDSPSERSFIKGQIIRIDLHDDYHMLKTIKEELEIGFFINKGGS